MSPKQLTTADTAGAFAGGRRMRPATQRPEPRIPRHASTGAEASSWAILLAYLHQESVCANVAPDSNQFDSSSSRRQPSTGAGGSS